MNFVAEARILLCFPGDFWLVWIEFIEKKEDLPV